jgi:hypothetical protein
MFSGGLGADRDVKLTLRLSLVCFDFPIAGGLLEDRLVRTSSDRGDKRATSRTADNE